MAVTGVISLRVSPKCTSHIIGLENFGIFTSAERPQQNKTSPSPFPLLILPTFHSVSCCERRKCIVLGLCSASLLVVLVTLLVVVLLLFVPQYGRLAAVFSLLAFNHYACLRNARRISYSSMICGIFTSAERPQQNKTSPSHFPLLFLPEFHSASRCGRAKVYCVRAV